MSDYVRGLTVAAAVLLGVFVLFVRLAPAHWSLRGPQRRARDASELFRWVNAAGRHVSTFRRLLAVGTAGCSRRIWTRSRRSSALRRR